MCFFIYIVRVNWKLFKILNAFFFFIKIKYKDNNSLHNIDFLHIKQVNRRQHDLKINLYVFFFFFISSPERRMWQLILILCNSLMSNSMIVNIVSNVINDSVTNGGFPFSECNVRMLFVFYIHVSGSYVLTCTCKLRKQLHLL